MNIQDIFKRILVKSGQFLLRTDNIELDPDRFKMLVEEVLAVYNEYRPKEGRLLVNVGSPRTVTFDETTTSEEGYTGPPAAIVDAVPVRPTAVNMYYLRGMGFKNVPSGGYLQDKKFTPFKYNNPKLTVAYSGDYDVEAIYHYEIVTSQDSSGTIIHDVPDLEVKDIYFFNMLQGKFLQSLGRSRRAFTINDLAITMDADQITSEGDEIYEKAFEQLVDNAARFYLAYGG
jgi:hypothetical protein